MISISRCLPSTPIADLHILLNLRSIAEKIPVKAAQRYLSIRRIPRRIQQMFDEWTSEGWNNSHSVFGWMLPFTYDETKANDPVKYFFDVHIPGSYEQIYCTSSFNVDEQTGTADIVIQTWTGDEIFNTGKQYFTIYSVRQMGKIFSVKSKLNETPCWYFLILLGSIWSICPFELQSPKNLLRNLLSNIITSSWQFKSHQKISFSFGDIIKMTRTLWWDVAPRSNSL